MIQLLWGILNLFLILSFFYFLIGLIFRGRKVLAGYSKLYTIPVLFLGFAALINPKEPEDDKPVSVGLVTMETIEVSRNLTNKISLELIRNKDSGKIIQERTYSSIHGFTSGLVWEHIGVVIEGKKLKVSGVKHWHLFGNTIFSQSEVLEIQSDFSF
jgi:hypothetical protein